jgi:hypothetical protein
VDGAHRLQRGDGGARGQHLAQLDLADGDAAVEGGADGLLGDGGLEALHRGVGLLGARLGDVEVRLGVGPALPEGQRPLQVDPGQRGVGDGGGQLGLLRRGVELDQACPA